jgi:hypothetical protein
VAEIEEMLRGDTGGIRIIKGDGIGRVRSILV